MTYNCEITQEGNLFIARFPDMPTIMTCGGSLDHALKMAEEALNGCLEVCIDDGLPIAEPKFAAGSPIEVAPKIAFAIQLRKNRANLTQKEVAAKLGMSYQQYQRLENPRKTNPTLEMIARLQRAFGKQFLAY